MLTDKVAIEVKPEDGIVKLVEFKPSDLELPPRSRTLLDLESFVAYVCKWGNEDRTVIYCTPKGAVAVLDETDNKDRIKLDYKAPLESEPWLSKLRGGWTVDHLKFKDFLEEQRHFVNGGEDFFLAIANLSLATSFSYDAKLDNERNYTIAVKKADGPDTTQIPRDLVVKLRVIDGLDDLFAFPVRLKMHAPSNSDEVPVFELTCQTFAEILEDAGKAARAELEKDLAEFLIVNGQPGEFRR